MGADDGIPDFLGMNTSWMTNLELHFGLVQNIVLDMSLLKSCECLEGLTFDIVNHGEIDAFNVATLIRLAELPTSVKLIRVSAETGRVGFIPDVNWVYEMLEDDKERYWCKYELKRKLHYTYS